ncbi:MAG: FMN-binding protein [Propionicimonas sp.]|nr:FMN-binding protein [Propionicimonas sp.]
MSRRLRAAAVLAGGLALAGCAAEVADLNVADGGFADGSYSGVSAPDDQGGYGEVEVTIAGDDVTAVEFVLRQADGTTKGEDYGKTNGQVISEEVYARAQAGIAAAPVYAARFVETDDLDAVDVVTGASLTHGQFLEAVADALGSARA